MSNEVTIALISSISGIVIAYIVNVVAKKVQEAKAEKQPKDRMEQMFDGYERLIKQKDVEDERKAKLIKALQANVTALETDLFETKLALEAAKDEALQDKKENEKLKSALDELRTEYKRTKEAKVN